MILIVAVSSNWGIGYKNRLLFHIREDLQRFKQITTGKTVVMGYNTFLSLPDSKPLPNRKNIVLSRKKDLQITGATVCDSLDALQILLRDTPSADVFIIGGENIYTQLLPHCTRAYITKVDAAPPADAFMPNLDELPNWKLTEEIQNHGEYSYSYVTYVNADLGQ
ncbi:MAG: dihydrofolate reductase [Defluviitaleaceae bacterium]|nr:dihydrofolate reductase [Defluviitaleaceae bacterium]MCL2262100.1 dihydrofolate reductase [Defluviitaleaceae bacterium]